uniref:Uncharacterized protein n=1 Tax=Anguilla anguilla TaxID=7936 RepID=A0A0E9RD77_ANGAN
MVLCFCLCFPCWAARWRHFQFVLPPCVNCIIGLIILSLFPPMSCYALPFSGLIVL